MSPGCLAVASSPISHKLHTDGLMGPPNLCGTRLMLVQWSQYLELALISSLERWWMDRLAHTDLLSQKPLVNYSGHSSSRFFSFPFASSIKNNFWHEVGLGSHFALHSDAIQNSNSLSHWVLKYWCSEQTSRLCMSFSVMTDDGAKEELVQHLLDERRCLGCWSAALVGNGEVSHVHAFT